MGPMGPMGPIFFAARVFTVKSGEGSSIIKQFVNGKEAVVPIGLRSSGFSKTRTSTVSCRGCTR